ncbi:hypothetical protein BCAL2905 [Burkholderia cenocepacia J2315]|uniref:Uncharacterized protein n=1 Tax=Burkholderia cenocepacia (strain ATCC BAA-245 / DSM 16553 / LMG 16656 / NCTC 13227 / J2315 / CF5610) TaxID=216591 RepID=B4EAL3_BURCJ|nr:hypothetical protein BCAL2905 [Burkholderia cenocepacia J2315]
MAPWADAPPCAPTDAPPSVASSAFALAEPAWLLADFAACFVCFLVEWTADDVVSFAPSAAAPTASVAAPVALPDAFAPAPPCAPAPTPAAGVCACTPAPAAPCAVVPVWANAAEVANAVSAAPISIVRILDMAILLKKLSARAAVAVRRVPTATRSRYDRRPAARAAGSPISQTVTHRFIC